MRFAKSFSSRIFTLLAAVSAAGLLSGVSVCRVPAEEMIVENSTEWETGLAAETETETEGGPLMETETIYEIPLLVTDGLKKNTPDGEVLRMKGSERSALLEDIYQANSAKELWKKHEDVSAVCSLFDEDARSWKEYSTFYADPVVYYSDDWTPGLEELRLLMYGENECVEDYAWSQRFVCFLNASGIPYRSAGTDPVTLDEDTLDEPLLRIHREEDSLFVVTQLTESSILRLSLDEPEGEAFYTSLYLLDPDTLEVRSVRISLHEPKDKAADEYTVRDVRNINYSYDHGMTPFVETGYIGLLRHLMPDTVWAPGDLREVEVTLDPGADEERVFSIITLKGDPISYTLPDGYELYCDESLTQRWIDNGDYTSDLSLWAAQ